MRGFPVVLPYLAMHFRAGNESQGRWNDPARHSLSDLDMFLHCANLAEQNGRLNPYGELPWFLAADVSKDKLVEQSAPDSLFMEYLAAGKIFFMERAQEVVHVDR